MIWLVVVIAFIYLIHRINGLEYNLSKLQSTETKPQPKPAQTSVPVQPVSAPVIPATVSTPKPFLDDKDWEMKLGGKFFTVIGSIAVLFGIAFFLKYAFDHDLISESARIILGFISGAIIIGIGQFMKEKYAGYGQLLVGLGLAIFYLSTFAGFNYYNLFSSGVAYGIIILTTALGLWFAISDDSELLASFAQFGGFVTPMLLGQNANHPHLLFGYILLLNCGLVILSFYKPWQNLNLGSLVGTILVYCFWFNNYEPAMFNIALGYASIFFLVFLTASLLQHLIQHSPSDRKALWLLTLNALFYFAVSYTLINPVYHNWMGAFTFGLGLLYLLLGFVTRSTDENPDIYHNFLWGLAFIFFFVGMPIQFKQYVTSVGWAAQALVLIILGFMMQARPIRYMAHGIFIITTIYALVMSSNFQSQAWINNRTISAAMIMACMIVGCYVYYTKKSEIESLQSTGAFAPKNEYSEAIAALGIQAYSIIFWVLSMELINARHALWLPISWSILSLAIGFAGIRMKNGWLRLGAYITFATTASRLVFFDSAINLQTFTPFFNLKMLGFIITFGAVTLLINWLNENKAELEEEERDMILPTLFFGSNVLLLWGLSNEINTFYRQKASQAKVPFSQYSNMKNVTLSITWLLYAVVNLAIGIISKRQMLRLLALILFGLVVLKVFLYDTVSLNNLYRFVSYITLGIILLFTGYLYNRYKDRIIHFIKAAD